MSAAVVLEAIALRKCIKAEYNRDQIIMAPHILYTRHDEPYVDGVTLFRNGNPPRELKFGSFKLTGLHDMALTEDSFGISELYVPADARYRNVTLFTVVPD